MRGIAVFIALVIILACGIHVVTVRELPGFIMSKVMSRTGGGVIDTFIEPKLATSSSHGVVRPSPDLAYSTCVLDLSKGPVRVTVPLTAPYTSVALYSSVTDNYFVRNDRETGGKDLDIIVIAPGAAKPVNAPAEVVEAPTEKGLVLVRRVVENAAAFPALDAIRQKATCAPFKG